MLDGTVNHIYDDGSEFRLVHRKGHDTVYLSSHAGCSLGCKMCWLTQQKQTDMSSIAGDDIYARAWELLLMRKSPFVNISFMARGDALANPDIDQSLIAHLTDAAEFTRLRDAPPLAFAKVSISTIFPKGVIGGSNPAAITEFLFERFASQPLVLYWSLYSLEPAVREEWLPHASDPEHVAAGLAAWQRHTFREIVVHHALIKGVNDDDGSVSDCKALLDKHGLRYRINLVRYNAAPGADVGEEADEASYAEHLRVYQIGAPAKVQQRVGPDVFASCGMFVAP